jgi:hypothetical protein
VERLQDRTQLLRSLDTLGRDIDDQRGAPAGMDAMKALALEMIRSRQVHEAFDLTREPEKVRDRYGKAPLFLMARRLVEAGVRVLTLNVTDPELGLSAGAEPLWDTHGANPGGSPTETNFHALRRKLPALDRAVAALLTDLRDRGLDRDVALVIWGEMGRTPKINKNGGRDHWGLASFALLAGAGLQTGQAIGDTGPRAERARGTPFTAQNVLATLYRLLGIDPETNLANESGRPIALLDDPTPIRELL